MNGLAQHAETRPAPDTTEQPVVTITGLEIRMPDGSVVLPETSLTVRAGQVTAVTGASGSGKTTLLRSLVGHLPAGARITAGAINVLGHSPQSLAVDELRRLRRTSVAYVGQDPGSSLNPRMSVRRLVSELASDTSDRAVLGLLAECRLPADTGIARRRPTALSGGQQRRVALARALARSPKVLLVDEPTAGLDAAVRAEIAHLLRELATRRQLAVVITTHDPELVAACADHTVRLTSTRRASSARSVAASTTCPDADRTAKPAHSGLIAQGVNVRFRDGHQPALADVDFSAAPGSATAIVGPSGSGKTTLLRVLAGLHPPDGGQLTLNGAPLANQARRRTRKQQRGIQLIPQNPLAALNPRRTVGHQLARPLRLHTDLANARLADRIAELLDQVELPAVFAHRYPGELSGGQRQRVSIARALAAGPDILLCDEVTSALDSDTATAVMDLLTTLRARLGTTVVVVSHGLHLVTRYTDTVYLLDAGRITGHGPTSSVLPV